MDFTLSEYKLLLKTLQDRGYIFTTFYDYLTQKQSFNHSINTEPLTLNLKHTVILRHDVDLKPQNSLATAKIEHKLGVVGSYYFRMVPDTGTLITQIKRIFEDIFKIKTAHSRNSEISSNASLRPSEKQYNPNIFNPKIIQQIAELGHEIGYHYETMDTEGTRLKVKGDKVKGDRKKGVDFNVLVDAAYEMFCNNLETIKKIYPVKTICMHGSPRSRYDNREIWKKYDYRQLGIIGEPYFDINFNEVFYLTDTGRRWDGNRVSVRDKMQQQEQWNKQGLRFRSTKDIIEAAKENRLPQKIMITVHPQRWTNSFIPWAKEMVWQNLKNLVKRILIENQER